MASLVVYVFGAFTLVGGVIGFVKAGSTASLIAGGVSGLVLLACGYGMQRGVKAAAIAALLVSLALALRFFGTYMQHHRIMPDLIMILLGFASAAAIVFGFLRK